VVRREGGGIVKRLICVSFHKSHKGKKEKEIVPAQKTSFYLFTFAAFMKFNQAHPVKSRPRRSQQAEQMSKRIDDIDCLFIYRSLWYT
jgi:hypothetical protein